MARPVLTSRQGLLVFLIAGVVASGCLAASAESEDAGVQPASGPEPAAAPAQFDDETGAIEGLVTDDDLRPLPLAEVGLDGAHWTTQTAADGSFSFSQIPPGKYALQVQRLGYGAVQVGVTVVAGEVSPSVKVQLVALPVVEPYTALFQFKGYITCTIGMFGVLSEECGQGVQTELGTFGTNPNNKIDWKWNVTQAQDLRTMLLELDWTPASAAAAQLTLYVAHGFKCTPSCGEVDGGVNYCNTDNHGPPVQRCQIDDLKIKDDAGAAWDMTSRAWGAPVEATEVPNIVLEQAFDMYRSEFFGLPMPEGYTAVVDG